jgi:co-chaperonin GroES (HSP10)
MITKEQFIEKHFPECDPGTRMVGPRVLVQLQYVPEKTQGGIVLVEDSREFNREHSVVGVVHHMGELAYRNRDSGARWREGCWVLPGDVVMVPKYGGMRFNRTTEDGKTIKFVILQDHEIISAITGQFEQLDIVL